MHDDNSTVTAALDIARGFIKAGVPVFLAPPCPDTCRRPGHDNGAGTGGSGFDLPSGWENAAPMIDVVDRWRPGWAMAAVCGHGVDILDVDPRNGGDIAAGGPGPRGGRPRPAGVGRPPPGRRPERNRAPRAPPGAPHPRAAPPGPAAPRRGR